VRIKRLDLGQQLETRTIGQHEVEQHDIDLLLAEDTHTLFGRGCLLVVEPVRCQE